jgi:hypothetical protein
MRAFSLRHEFSNDWYNFLRPRDAVPDQTLVINLTQDRFPFRYRGKKIQIYQLDMFLKFRDIYDPVQFTANGTPLGDYAGGGALRLNVTPPSGMPSALQLVSKLDARGPKYGCRQHCEQRASTRVEWRQHLQPIGY